MMEGASLPHTVGSSVFSAVMLPLRLALWVLQGVLWLAIPAFLFAALLHYCAGDAVRAVRDVLFFLACGVALGLVRFVRARRRRT
jgi:hypothetical protein